MTKKILFFIGFIVLAFFACIVIVGISGFSKSQDKANQELAASYLNLGNIYLQKKENLLALENYTKTLNIDSHNTNALLGYGKAALQEGEIIPRYFLQILKNDPFNEEANFYMGLISIDKPDKAREYFSQTNYQKDKKETILRFLNTWPTNFSSILHKRLLIAQIDIAIGQNKLAINLLHSVVEERPDYRDAWILLGQAYSNSGQKNKASDSFAQALELDGDNEEIQHLISGFPPSRK